jgi:hypothetical protein
LALALGLTVRQLLAQTTSLELNEWRAYYALEPFGDLVADQRHGIAQALTANLQRDAKRRPQPYTPEDFIPWHESHRNKGKSDKRLTNKQLDEALIKALLPHKR